ncbi:MAG: quinolinate synthase NadA [Methanosarcina flavescens]|jgi:quinolinate synthase|uniref:Quinolinate synthase n=1 Tax=Methanosarcina flavescens TaxID=1715806 RepID=A0A660HNP6_9EURY|nr:quinolinate synthase NadA [Methanosarcina flavescens]AYK13901.1 quinolinate synthase NadA [Methanosarcina flavescens]NLK33352.1 quinolinate synthase NadA [Methanosarcina flavescens]
MENELLIEEIKKLKAERNAVILSHFYTRREVQEVADFVGDSLSLCKAAVDSKADIIVFAGVYFMAESALIISPEKTVLLPVPDAGCPMADMITAEALRDAKEKHPEAEIVCYVNSSAAVKAESDICCTSANAIKVVNSIEGQEVLFVPDKNLGAFVALHTDKKIHLWPGFCHVHENIRGKDIEELKKLHPDAEFLAHPECRPEVLSYANGVLSTSGIIREVERSGSTEFIIGTEKEIVRSLKRKYPDKKFYPASEKACCYNMKKITLEAVLNSLQNMEYEISVPEHIRVKARKALNRMLEISGN